MVTSKYARGVLICSIIAIIIFAIPFFLSIPIMIWAKDVVKESFAGNEDLVDSTVGLIIFIIVVILATGIFSIVSGFLFAKKDKWGMACIVLAIVLAVLCLVGFISCMTDERKSALEIVFVLLNIANFTCLSVFSIKHRLNGAY